MTMKKVALVTGGTRGIGRAISETLAANGCKVVASFAKNVRAAESFHASTGITVVKFDASCFSATSRAISNIERDYGDLDILVNNAGITRDSSFRKMGVESWQEVLDTDLTACFNTSRVVFEGMRNRGFGRIVNISSVNGQTGQFGQVNYSAAKAGVIGFTKALALEGASFGITVNAVAPGYINTDMVRSIPEKILPSIVNKIPVGRMGEPSEVARAVEFLASENAGFITGSTLNINGGQYLL